MIPKTFILTLVFATTYVATAVGQTAVPNTEVALSRCWSFAVEDGMAVALNGTHIFVGSGGGKVQALSPDGSKLWASDLGGEIASDLLAGEGGVFLATSVSSDSGKSGQGTLRYLSRETGITGWTAKLPDADSYSLGLRAQSVVVVTSRGTIQAFDASNGAAKWRRELAEGFVGEPRFNQMNVYVASTAKQIFTVSLSDGEVIAVQKLRFSPTAVAEITGDVFAGDDRGNLTSLGKAEKASWNFKSGGKISALVEVGENLLAASNDNFVYLFSGRNGRLAWKRRLDDRVSQIGLIDGKFALVSGYEENGVQLIDLHSGRMVGQINLAEDEFATARPVSFGGRIFILTTKAVYAYSPATCL
jgi:outer membrane protein assembly factor BamB